MNLTQEQSDILQAIKDNRYKYIKVIAFAGTGKTFTLTQIAKNTKGEKLYLAFNKAIEIEAKSKFKDTSTTVFTTHALAYKTIIRTMGFRLKTGYNPKEIMELLSIKDYYAAKYVLEIVEDFCNSDLDKMEDLKRFAKSKSYIQKKAKEFMNKMATNKLEISFSAMLKLFQVYLSRGKIKLPNYRLVMLDEAQDTNDVTLAIFRAIEAQQKILVGDPHQQIYSFRGGVNALNKIEDAKEYALTNSFRYVKYIGDKASSFLKLFKDEFRQIHGKAQKGDIKSFAYISRSNTKLIEKINEMATKEKPFRSAREPYSIFGLALNLIKIRKYFSDNEEEGEDEKVLNIDKDFSFLWLYVNEYKKINNSSVFDIGILDYIVDEINDSNDEVVRTIKLVKQYSTRLSYLYSLLKENNKSKEEINTYFTTAHTAKGLEWDCVELLDDFPAYNTIVDWFIDNNQPLIVKNPYDYFLENCKDSKYIDELNLYYVAVTRAKYNLIDNTDFNDMPFDGEGLNLYVKNLLAKKAKKLKKD